MNLVYYLFTKYGILPHQYEKLSAGEKLILLACVDYYFKEARS